MRQDELAMVLLVRAFEEGDAEGRLLPMADREAATREAARSAGQDAAHPGGERALLAARARALYPRITSRYPVVENVRSLALGVPALELLLAFVGLAAGAALSALDGPRRIEIFSLPLLALLAWNFLVYGLLAARALRSPRGRPPADRLGGALSRVPGSLAARAVARVRSFDTPLAAALGRFVQAWFPVALPVQRARASRAIHLAAAAVGLGLIAGLYLRGLVLDYRAGWESTFLAADRAAAIAAALYGPAAWLAGLAPPGAAELDAMRWPRGEPAARWIHLIATTVLAAVVIPRLALAARSGFAAWRRASRLEPPADLDAHFRQAFAAIESVVPRARAVVLPYAHALGAAQLARLIAAINADFGGRIDVEAADAVPYGEEERYLAGFASRARADLVVLPFALATTPEDENHGRVVEGVRDALAAARPPARLLLVVDEGDYRARMAGAPERVDERRRLWKAFASARGVEARFVELSA